MDKRFIFLVLLFLSFLPFVASAPTNITSCGQTISAPGEYALNQTLNGTTTCLTVTGSDISIDCMGNTIGYGSAGGNGAIGINAVLGVIPKTNLTVKNCNIRDINASGTTGYGIMFTRYSNSYIFNNTINTNGTSSNFGIYLTTSSNDNIIENNTINALGSTTTNYGIHLLSASDGNIIRGNTVVSQGTTTSYALYLLTGSDSNFVYNNSLTTKSTTGTGNTDGHTVYISGSISNIITDNRIYAYSKARNYAVYLLNTANNNTITYNEINNLGNESANYGVYASSSSSNRIVGNDINLRNGTSANYGVYASASNLNDIRDNEVYIKGTTGLIGVYNLNSFSNNLKNNTVIVNGSGATNYGIFLSASYLTNISESTVFVNGTTPLYGVYLLGAELNNISNNNVSTFGTTANAPMSLGISSNYNFIFNNTLNSRGVSTLNYGCYLTQANRNTITQNTITTNGTTTNYGVYLLTNTKHNIIKDNIISTYGTTTNYGMFLSAAGDNFIIGNNITTNGTTKIGTTNNWGIHLAVNSENNHMINNTIITDGGGLNYGLSLITNSRTNNYTGNKVYSGGNGTTNVGAYVSESSYNVFNDNIISTQGNNTGSSTGFYLHSSSRFNNIKNNNISTIGANSHAFDFLFITPGYPESNIIENNNLIDISGRDINFGTASINGTWFIDQIIGNYSFTTLGGLINIKNTSAGEIRFLTPINGTNITFSNSIFINNNFARIDEYNRFLNKSAEITLYNRPTSSTELQILRNGVVCPSEICTNLTSMQAGNVTFNVTSGGDYSINSTTISPVITLNAPVNTFNVSRATLPFNFTASDDISTILNCSIYLNSILNQTNSTTSSGNLTNFEIQSLEEGNHSWSVSCLDEGGNLGESETRTFNVNFTIPTVSLDSPNNNSYVDGVNSVLLSYTVYDLGLNNNTVWIYGNNSLLNTSYNVSNGTTLTYLWTGLNLGTYNWSVISNNGLKNSSSNLMLFNLINLTINCEAGGPYQEGALVLIQGNISDGISGISSQTINISLSQNGVINSSNNLISLASGSFQTTFSNLANGNYTLNTSLSYQGINDSCVDNFNISASTSGTTSSPASLVLNKLVTLQELNSTTIVYNITLQTINSGGSNATSTILNDSDSTSSPYNLGLLPAGNINQTSYSKSHIRNSTNYNISLSLGMVNATDSLSGNQITANSSLITLIVPATTANTNLTLTKNAQFLSENSTSVIYNLSVIVVNSGGIDLSSITIADSDISLSSSIDLNRTQSYSTSGTKTIAKSTITQTHNFLKSNATHSTVLYESNQLQILIPAIASNSSLTLSKLASLHSQTNINITYNISLTLTNSGGSNSTNTNITDSDSSSSPYSIGSLTAGQQYQTSYLFTLPKASSSSNYALANATAYGINQINNNLLTTNSSQLVVNVPAIATNASLLLTKSSSVHSLNTTDIVYNITLTLTNSGGVNSTNTNITDSDSTSSPYILNNITSGQSVLRSYLLNFSRNSTTSIRSLSNSTAYSIDSLSNNLVTSFASSSNITIPSNLTQSYTSASLVLNKFVSMQELNSTTIVYNLTIVLTNAGGSNATNTLVTDSDSASSPYSIGTLIPASGTLRSYTKNYVRNSTNYNISLSLALANATDNLTSNQITANSSLITLIVPASTANTLISLTKNAQFLSENATSVIYNLSLDFVNSGGIDLSGISIQDSDISLDSTISLNRTQSYSTSGTKSINKGLSSQQYQFLNSNATYNSVTYESNQISVLIPSLEINSSLVLSKLASLYSQTSVNITYNVSLRLTNSGGVNSTNTNITDSDSTSSPYNVGNLTHSTSYLTSYLFTLPKASSSSNYALSNATAYGLDLLNNNLLSSISPPLIINVPAIATNASLLLTKSSSVHSLNATDIVYNITLSLINSGGVNSTNTNITDSDSSSSPYNLGNLTAGQSVVRTYLLNFSRASTTSIITLSNATAYGLDSLSNNQIQSFIGLTNITIPSNLTQTYNPASLILDKIVSFHNISNSTINYNVTLRLTNAGGVNSTNTNITDSDSTSSPYSLNNLTSGESVLRSYILNFSRNSSSYSVNLSKALSYGLDNYYNILLNSNSSVISVSIPSSTVDPQLTLIKNAYFNSENSTAVNYTVRVEVVNSGGEDLSAITIIDSDLSLNTLINLNRTQSYNSSSSIIIQKEATNSERLLVKATATVNAITYESNQINLQIAGYGGPADTIVYAPASVNVSTSFDSIIQITNQNPDIGQNFLADYWITNNDETVNYSSGQQTIYVAASSSTNLTATLSSPSVAGTYRVRALVSYVGGPDFAFDSFEVGSSNSSNSSSPSTSSSSSGGGGGSYRATQQANGSITGNAVEEVICNSPYIRYGIDCCLDNNANLICDVDEAASTEENEPQVKETNYLINILDALKSKLRSLFNSGKEDGYYLRNIGLFILLTIACFALIKLIIRKVHSKHRDTKRLSHIKGTKVYFENGDFAGKIVDVYLEDQTTRIYGWVVKLDRKLSKKTGLKNIMVRQHLVKSIKEIMIVNENVESHLENFKQE